MPDTVKLQVLISIYHSTHTKHILLGLQQRQISIMGTLTGSHIKSVKWQRHSG